MQLSLALLSRLRMKKRLKCTRQLVQQLISGEAAKWLVQFYAGKRHRGSINLHLMDMRNKETSQTYSINSEQI